MGWAMVDVRDIADLHVRAMTAPNAAGERNIGAGDFYWISDISNIIRHLVRVEALKPS
jgi:nucleoside-diphosphate-sugar epimerase